jgi:hypothetical protein
MGLFNFLRGKCLSERVLGELAGRCCGALMSCYDYFNDRATLKNDRMKLKLLFRLMGFVLLYTDHQIYASKGPEARSDAMEKLIRLVGSAIASGMPDDPQYKLRALLEPSIEVEGNIRVQTSAYLMGMVQEVFQKYGVLLAGPNGLERAIKDFSKETCSEFVGASHHHPAAPVEFQILLMTALGSMRLKEILS